MRTEKRREQSFWFDFGDGNGHVEARRHAHGGGIVALTAQVEASVFVSGNAWVYGYAEVRGHACIGDRARVSGARYPGSISTLIEDRVVVTGTARVEGCVLLRDEVQVRDAAQLSGMVRMLHRTVARDRIRVEGDVEVRDRVYLCDDVHIVGGQETIVIGGTRVINGDATYCRNQAFQRRRTRRVPERGIVAPSPAPAPACHPLIRRSLADELLAIAA